MKTKNFLICLILGAALFVSCYNDPSEKEMQGYLAALRPYYPYPKNGTFIYVNDTLERTWEVKVEKNMDDNYPYTNMTICKREITSKCSGDRSVSIWTHFMKEQTPYDQRAGMLSTEITYMGGASSMEIYWSLKLYLNDDEHYQGGSYTKCGLDEVLSQFTDTIILSIDEAENGAYARIIKNQGLADFSVDGKTVWRRVKE